MSVCLRVVLAYCEAELDVALTAAAGPIILPCSIGRVNLLIIILFPGDKS